MSRELEGFIIAGADEGLTITKVPSVRVGRAATKLAFFVACLGGSIASAISLTTSGEWPAMVGPQKVLSVGIVVTLLSMAIMFGRALYFALDRGFSVRASRAGVTLRRHHFSRLSVPHELVSAVRVHARTYQAPHQPRHLQVRVELELRELDDSLELLVIGLGAQRVRDDADNRARLTEAGVELGRALAKALDVPLERTDFRT